MITTTLQAIYDAEVAVSSLHRSYIITEAGHSRIVTYLHRLYIVYEGETCLYVGQSKNVIQRIRSHHSDELKRYIDANYPACLACTVQLCTIEDCQALLNWQGDQATINDYEWLLIRRLAPRLNVVANSAYWPHVSEKSLTQRPEFAQAVQQAFPSLLQEVIYVLEDPRDNAIRYVGRTSRSVARRLLEHISVTYLRNIDIVAWVAELKALGLLPILHVIDSAPEKIQAIEREKLWIRWYFYVGEPLLNRPPGPSGQWKLTHRPPLILPEMSEQKLLQLAAATGERPHAILERLLERELGQGQGS